MTKSKCYMLLLPPKKPKANNRQTFYNFFVSHLCEMISEERQMESTYKSLDTFQASTPFLMTGLL